MSSSFSRTPATAAKTVASLAANPSHRSTHSNCCTSVLASQGHRVALKFHTTSSSSTSFPSAQAGPSRLARGAATEGRTKTSRTPRPQQARKPILLPLDPRRPLVPPLTSIRENSNLDEKKESELRAKRLVKLHVALQTGWADEVWSAYLELRQHHQPNDSHNALKGTALGGVVTPEECRDIFNIISNDATKTKRGVNRILRLMSDVRSQQRRLLTHLQHASESNKTAHIRMLNAELKQWDSVVSAKLLNATIGYIGKSLRTVGLDEVDQVLDQLLSFEANERSRSSQSNHISKALPNPSSASRLPDALASLRAAVLSPTTQSAVNKRSGTERRQQGFPNIATYNTILDIITRTVHRSNPARRTASNDEPALDDEDDAMTKFTEQHLASRSDQLNASLATKLRRFDLDPEAAPLHLDALERADRLFHSVLERMQRTSRVEPDQITFNIMITMYCLLDRWEAIHRVVRLMCDRGVLNVDCVNNTLRHWLQRGPAPANGNNVGHGDGRMDTALEVYRQLRQNLIQSELASSHSDIMYGRRAVGSFDIHDKSNDGPDAEQETMPLTWPDRNEPAPGRRTRFPAAVPRNEAVEAVLGIQSLPLDLVPDEITHSLIIGSLTREGRFADALSVFKDLVSTPVRRSTARTQTKGDGDARRDEARDVSEEDEKMEASLAIFDSFFRGFSRHGRPSRALTFDAEQPEQSTWELVPIPAAEETQEDGEKRATLQPESDEPHAHQRQLWRIETFQEIFDAFLNLEPDVSRILVPNRSDRRMVGRRESRRTVLTSFGWLTLAEKRRLDASRRAPSSNQLFWILTAIRRVSHDHAGWSLAMWQKVVDKFAPNPAASSSSEKLGWLGFRLDNRLRRVLEHLESRQAEQQPEDADN